MEGCGNTCAALFRAVDAALEGEIAREGEAARAREAARIGEEGGGTASDGGGGTCEARTRVPPLGAPGAARVLRAPGPFGRHVPGAARVLRAPGPFGQCPYENKSQ